MHSLDQWVHFPANSLLHVMYTLSLLALISLKLICGRSQIPTLKLILHKFAWEGFNVMEYDGIEWFVSPWNSEYYYLHGLYATWLFLISLDVA